MKVSLFPKGRYIAKSEILYYKNPYTNTHDTNISGRPFSLILENKRGLKTLWDIESFRPDPFLNKDVSDRIKADGFVDAIVLYEKINCHTTSKCFKIPRYIYIPHSEKTEEKWFVNTR